MYSIGISKYRIAFLFALILYLIIGFCGFSVGQPSERNSTVKNEEEIIAISQDIAKRNHINTDGCYINIIKENHLVVVTFTPNTLGIGGGVEMYFMEENGKYYFIKAVLGQ